VRKEAGKPWSTANNISNVNILIHLRLINDTVLANWVKSRGIVKQLDKVPFTSDPPLPAQRSRVD
jgi:hypothetical protein